MKSVRTRSGGAFALLLCAAAAQAGPILFVDDGAPAGGDGASWETAFDTLQAALDGARAPGSGVIEIRVGQGLYKPDRGPGRTPGDRTQSFQLVSGVALRGGYAGLGAGDPNNRAPQTFVTTLSGDLSGNDAPGFVNYGENSYSVVSGSLLSVGTALDGFHVRSGSADAPFPNSEGGGADVRNSTLTVQSCVFADNIAIYGAGVYAQASTVTVVGCDFRDNFAYFFGAGLLSDGGTLRMRFTTMSGNESLSSGGGFNFINADAVVHGCTFRDNRAFNGGGGLLFGGTGTFVNCRFLGNIADGLGGGAAGQSTGGDWTGCVFSGNFAGGDGGALHIPGGAVRSCTISLNTAVGMGGGVFGNTTTVDNSILWGNTDMRGAIAGSQIEAGLSPAQVNYSIVQGHEDRPPYIGGDNSGLNPLFVNATGPDDTPGTNDDDLRLGAGSPGVDSGSNALLPMDPADVDSDMDVNEQLPLDIAGEARRIDDPSAPDTGSGAAPIVDRGALERIGVPPPPCPADLSGDGLVNSVDLSQLLGAWGPNAGPADLSGDGLVNSVDLSQMLGAWGACPTR